MIYSSDRLSVPNIPSEIDPFEIAYLRGDKQELARSVIFGLVKKEYIEFSEEKDKIIRNDSNFGGRLSNIEQISLEWLGKERAANEVFARGSALSITRWVYKNNRIFLQSSKSMKTFAKTSLRIPLRLGNHLI